MTLINFDDDYTPTGVSPREMTLADARAFVERGRLTSPGVECPCCEKLCLEGRRKISSRQAAALILVYRLCGTNWGHVPTLHPRLAGDGGEISRLRFGQWALVEEATDRVRDDGGRAGWWRITSRGEQFVLGNLLVPKYGWSYNGEVRRFDLSEMVSITDCLGSRFRYDELMGVDL